VIVPFVVVRIALVWRAARPLSPEAVSETVIAAVLLLHERSVEEIVAKLRLAGGNTR
jgi:hypothetical protein